MFINAIEACLKSAFQNYSPEFNPIVTKPNKSSDADFQCNDVFRLAAQLGGSSKQLAVNIANDVDFDGIATISVSGLGYLNIYLSDDYIVKCVQENHDSGVYIDLVPKTETIVLDYGAPNVAKALHVGHLRSFVIGESVRRILKSIGHTVISDIHYGDWGLPIGKLFLGMLDSNIGFWKEGEGHPLPELDLASLGAMYRVGNELSKTSDYHLAAARKLTCDLQKGVPEIRRMWEHVRAISLDAISGHIDMLGVHFDTYYGESDAHNDCASLVEALVDAGVAKVDDGAVIAFGDEDVPPVVLETKHKTALYGTTDLVTIVHRTEQYAPDKIVYFTDVRQTAHFQSVIGVAHKAHKMGVEQFSSIPDLVHAYFGTVKDADGQSFSTRDGDPVLLENMIDAAVAKAKTVMHEQSDQATAEKIAMAALKFSDLMSDRRTGYTFDLDSMLSFTGRTGPYLQYACVRVSSLIEKAKHQGFDVSSRIGLNNHLDKELAIACLKLSGSVQVAASTLQPKEVCDACYLIATCISRLYADCDILNANEPVRSERLALLLYGQASLLAGLYLLGIEVPDRM